MGTNETNAVIILRFQELKLKLDSIFDEKLWWSFESKMDDFLENLQSEIISLPNTQDTNLEIYALIGITGYRIERAKLKSNISEIGRSKLRYLKKLKTRLTEIRATLLAESNEEDGNNAADKEQFFTLKQQILLLKALRILDMEELKSLPHTKQASLFSHLLNYSKKTVKDLLTHHDNKNAPADFFLFKEKNIKKVNDLLESVDLHKYVIEK